MFVQDVGKLLLMAGPAAQLMKPDATNVVREVILKEYVVVHLCTILVEISVFSG